MLPELPKLEVPATLDHRTAPGLVVRAYAALDADPRGLVLDLGATEDIDAVGLQALASLHRYATGGGAIFLENVSDAVATRLRAEGLDARCFVRRQETAPPAGQAARSRDPEPKPAGPGGSHLRLVRDD